MSGLGPLVNAQFVIHPQARRIGSVHNKAVRAAVKICRADGPGAEMVSGQQRVWAGAAPIAAQGLAPVPARGGHPRQPAVSPGLDAPLPRSAGCIQGQKARTLPPGLQARFAAGVEKLHAHLVPAGRKRSAPILPVEFLFLPDINAPLPIDQHPAAARALAVEAVAAAWEVKRAGKARAPAIGGQAGARRGAAPIQKEQRIAQVGMQDRAVQKTGVGEVIHRPAPRWLCSTVIIFDNVDSGAGQPVPGMVEHLDVQRYAAIRHPGSAQIPIVAVRGSRVCINHALLPTPKGGKGHLLHAAGSVRSFGSQQDRAAHHCPIGRAGQAAGRRDNIVWRAGRAARRGENLIRGDAVVQLRPCIKRIIRKGVVRRVEALLATAPVGIFIEQDRPAIRHADRRSQVIKGSRQVLEPRAIPEGIAKVFQQPAAAKTGLTVEQHPTRGRAGRHVRPVL